MITSKDVLQALGTVNEPELHKDLVTLNMIENVAIQDGKVSFKLVLTTPACPLRGKIEHEAKEAVMKLDGIKEVVIDTDAKVISDGKIRDLLSLPIHNVVAVASGKGGVGKSTVSVNLAASLAMRGARVGLLDADIYGPNIPTMMGVDHLPAPKENRLQPAVAYGVKMMSIGFMVRPGQPLIWRGPMLHTAIRQFLADVEWGELDYLIVDMPPGTGDAQLSLMQSVELSGGVIVTLPQQVSLDDASRGLSMFREMKVPVLGIIENMSYLEMPDGTKMDIFGQGGGAELARASKTPFLGEIPMEADVRIGGDSGKPIVVTNPESHAAKAMQEITEKLAAQISMAAFAARAENN